MSANHELTGWNILLVDDDPGGLYVLQEILNFYGATTHAAWNGQKALQLTQEETFDLIMTDLSMPVMDGLELTIALKKDPATAHIPVIIVTAHVLDRQSASEAGCHGVMTKPINITTLLSELRQFFPDRLGTSKETKTDSSSQNTTETGSASDPAAE